MAQVTHPERTHYRLSADIGGTFTDIVLLASDGAYWTNKVSSTPDDYARGIIEGVAQLLGEHRLDGARVDEIIHGTTVASNTILENKGVETALITTRGFRDVLELRRLRIPHLYDISYVPPPPLVERRLRLEVGERIGADGAVVQPLDEADVHDALRRLDGSGVQAVAVCLLHSYRNPEHERRVGEILASERPDLFCSLSVDVLPEIREYERTSTTVINAYLGPIVKRYMDSLVRQLEGNGLTAPLRIMQSNGGVVSARNAAESPVKIVESGPTAGVVAGHQIGLRVGLYNIITFDMGGTTAKASLIEDGRPSWTTEHEVGAGISLSSRLVKGGGYAVKVPVMDLAEVGAGGGSIVWIDRGGALKAGPRSAGAVPGPVCYGFGGTDPTVTDANVALGYINPHCLAGGAVEIDAELARGALQEKVARPLGLELAEAAHGVHTVANVSMIRAIRAVSTYRGRDPRDFTLLAFGGSGPIHAANIARSLSIGRVIVPPACGVFSAVGLLDGQPEYHFVQTFFRHVAGLDLSALNAAYDEVEARARSTLGAEGYHGSEIVWQRSADLRYVGQAHELTVETIAHRLDDDDLAALVERFHQEHERTYGHKAVHEPVELVNVRMSARAKSERVRPTRPKLGPGPAGGSRREAYFGPTHGVHPTPAITRADLTATAVSGPLVVEEFDATTVVPPGCTARIDEWSNIVIDVDANAGT